MEGLEGVEGVEMDVARDLFHISVAATLRGDEILKAVRGLGYKPAFVDEAAMGAPRRTADGQMPEAISNALEKARAEGKSHVLIELSAPM